MKKILAVLTEEMSYAERFCDYCNRRKSMLFTAVPFDSIEKCIEFGRKHSIELLLADSRFIEGKDGYNTKAAGIRDIHSQRMVSLEEGCGFSEAFADSDRDGMVKIGKYQPAELIVRDIMTSCGRTDAAGGSMLPGRQVRIIGVYSPISRCGKSSFALTLCRVLGRRQRTLYISLEEFSVIEALTAEEYTIGLSDAVYHMKQGTLNSERLYSMIHSFCGVEFIPPMKYADDKNAVSGEDYVQLINEIAVNSLFDVIVIDMERYADEASDIMEVCDTVYMPVLDDSVNRKKTERFMEYLGSSGKGYISEKIIRISLPPAENAVYGVSYIDSLLYGSMGDMVRELENI